MSSKSGVQLNETRLKPLINKYAAQRAELKKKIKDESLSFEERFKCMRQLDKLPKRSSQVRYKTRCLKTFRAGGVIRKVGLKQYPFLQCVSQGILPGFTLISW